MVLAKDDTFAGYTIIRLLGAGGMGEVYLARHPRLPREEALKILTTRVTTDAEYRQRFEREAEMVATLWHPHIVAVHDRGEFDGKLWLAMDYVDGTDAGELLLAHPGGLPTELVIRIVDDVAEALDYAHARHLLHRDIKPSNILVTRGTPEEQRILLVDFGVARREDESQGLTATNMTVGTVAYAAPEQLMGKPLDGRADQYALAATAFHLLTGAPLFQNSNPAVVISQQLTTEPPKLGERRPDLANMEGALLKALSKDPAKRYLRCVDFARALSHEIGAADAIAGTPAVQVAGLAPPGAPAVSVPASEPVETPRSWFRTGILVPALVALLLVAAGVFAIGRLGGDGQEAPDTPIPPSPTVTKTGTGYPPGTESVAIGARCATPGATATTDEGSTAHCANLQYTDRYLWSLVPGEIPNPIVTTSPKVPPPYEDESPVRICMEQTGRSESRCAQEILRGNAS
jgi:serine/threonine-protein kinase